MQDEEWLVATWRGSWVITSDTLCCIAALTHWYTILLYFTVFKAKKKRVGINTFTDTTKQTFLPLPVFLETSYLHSGQPFTGEINRPLIKTDSRFVLSIPYYIFMCFQTPVSWRKDKQPLPVCATMWSRECKSETKAWGWHHPREHITSDMHSHKNLNVMCSSGLDFLTNLSLSLSPLMWNSTVDGLRLGLGLQGLRLLLLPPLWVLLLSSTRLTL